ncbi:hypothetical protein E4T50_06140 [Aureobasidium sp. EXF-12298]|nr:hypothetical protein E4T50_06140 [Aureobasidium sp. EXF-12298]
MDSHSNNPSAEDAPTKMQDIETKKQGSTNPSDPNNPADPAFFSLTLEERNNIYHQLLDPKGKKYLAIEPSNSLKAINKLLNVSPEVRTEVTTLIASETKALVQAGLYYDLTLEPHTVAIPSKPKKRKSKKSKKQNTTTTELTDDLKTWKMEIVVFTAEKYVRVKAQMDFKEKSVKVDLPGFGASIFSSNYCDYLFEEFEEAFLKAMKTFTNKDGFDGFVFKDVPELLHKVEMPCPKHFWDCDELFGDEYSDEWDESDDYDDYYDDEEGEGQDDFGEENNECSDEEDYHDEEGEDGEEDGENGDAESGVTEDKGKVDDGEVKVKAEGVEAEKTKSEVADAAA